eukprot:SAG31_NODE_4059_length_3630_cov_2.094308_1_plen_267_part_00
MISVRALALRDRGCLRASCCREGDGDCCAYFIFNMQQQRIEDRLSDGARMAARCAAAAVLLSSLTCVAAGSALPADEVEVSHSEVAAYRLWLCTPLLSQELTALTKMNMGRRRPTTATTRTWTSSRGTARRPLVSVAAHSTTLPRTSSACPPLRRRARVPVARVQSGVQSGHCRRSRPVCSSSLRPLHRAYSCGTRSSRGRFLTLAWAPCLRSPCGEPHSSSLCCWRRNELTCVTRPPQALPLHRRRRDGPLRLGRGQLDLALDRD